MKSIIFYSLLLAIITMGCDISNKEIENLKKTVKNQQKQIEQLQKQTGILERKLKRYGKYHNDFETKLHIEGFLKKWDVNQESENINSQAISKAIVKDVDISGEWEMWLGTNMRMIMVFLGKKEKLFVLVHVVANLLEWRFERTGKYIDGVLHLDKPIVDYMFKAYSKLYTIKHKGNIYLIPPHRASEFELSIKKAFTHSWLKKNQ